MSSHSASVAALTQAAQTYRDNHHWVPLRLKGKNPDMGKRWTKRTMASPLPKFKEGDNIGALLGTPSGGVVRLDPDFPSIPTVTQILFPESSLTFGRKSSPGSGRLVTCKGIKTTNFILPSSMKGDPRLPLHDGEPSLVVFQLLSTGAQTVVPPSVHPESGEDIIWENEDTPLATFDPKVLLHRVGIEAFLMAVRQFWPARGVRNEAAMALARVLLETIHGDDEERLEVIDALVLAVAMAGGAGEASRDGKHRAANTLKLMKAGEPAKGMTELLEMLGLPAGIGKTFRKWLGVTVPYTQGALRLDHFWSFGPMNQFFFVPSLALWPASSVDARLRPVPVLNADGSPKRNKRNEEIFTSASKWLSQNRSVETMTWAPGYPAIIPDKAMTSDGGLCDARGFRCFNTDRAPPPPQGNAMEAGRWVDLVKKLYPNDAEEIFDYAAHRVQKPADKINHCLVLLGVPGIGKDTLIAGILRAVGTWNCSEASPQDFFESFNPHVKAVIMRINEAHDLGDVSRFSFYERTKTYAASPPETLPINDKNIRKYYIPNVCGIIITSNYRTECLYLPADDRRHYVAWSDVRKEEFDKNFWDEYWKWFNGGGDQHIAAGLPRALSLSIQKHRRARPTRFGPSSMQGDQPRKPKLWMLSKRSVRPAQ
jgi:hypothetical protein